MSEDFALTMESTEEQVMPAPHMKMVKPRRELVQRREMTADEIEALRCLAQQVTYTPGSWDKRFARGMGSMATITEKESAQVWRLFKRYRRQIMTPEKALLLAMAEQLAAQDLRKIEAQEREKERCGKGVACG